MTVVSPPNPRASLLAGLRTGGVRSTSTSIPHTAAPGASFHFPRFASQHHPSPLYEDEEDHAAMSHPAAFEHHLDPRTMPMTAAVDGPDHRFAAHQASQRGLNPNSIPFSPAFNPNYAPQTNANQLQNQAFQMQMLQLEMLRIQVRLFDLRSQDHSTHPEQNLQAQTEIAAQAQRQMPQSQMPTRPRLSSLGFNPPSTAGPLANSFDLRSIPINPQLRRLNQAEQLRSQPSVVAREDEPPMTAALGGRFGSRVASFNAPGRFTSEEYEPSVPPSLLGSTTVISGGTALGNSASNSLNSSKVASNPPSKSDSVSTWRRGGNNNSVLSGNNRTVSSPSVKITPPSEQLTASPSLPPALVSAKFRPRPLRFSEAAAQPLPAVTIDTSADGNDNDDTSSSSSSTSNSSPNTPRSSSSNGTSLSPREEASKRLYEGLGIGRPASATFDIQQPDFQYPLITSVATHRMASQPTRQPRGPPSGADELGSKNFATRIRRHAIDGLGALMDARERRELVEAL